MCTSAKIKSIEGHFYWARTMDFAQNFFECGGEIIYFPKHLQMDMLSGPLASKYEVVGMGIQDTYLLTDGINSEGLAGGCFYFEEATATSSQELTKKELQEVVLDELVVYILSQCKSVDEIVGLVSQFACIDKGTSNKMVATEGKQLPVHLTFTDKEGYSIVLEPDHDGQFTIYTHTNGIMTNSPKYEWHLTNLRNYVNMSDYTIQQLNINNLEVKGIESGSGLLGLPGDYTSPSRFIKIALLSNMMQPTADKDALRSLYTVFNSVIIPKGIEKNTSDSSDYTAYWIGYDLENRCLEVLSTANQTFTKVSLEEASRFFNNQKGHTQVKNENYFHKI